MGFARVGSNPTVVEHGGSFFFDSLFFFFLPLSLLPVAGVLVCARVWVRVGASVSMCSAGPPASKKARQKKTKKNHEEKKQSRQRGSNPRSTAYEAVALPLGHTGTSQRRGEHLQIDCTSTS